MKRFPFSTWSSSVARDQFGVCLAGCVIDSYDARRLPLDCFVTHVGSSPTRQAHYGVHRFCSLRKSEPLITKKEVGDRKTIREKERKPNHQTPPTSSHTSLTIFTQSLNRRQQQTKERVNQKKILHDPNKHSDSTFDNHTNHSEHSSTTTPPTNKAKPESNRSNRCLTTTKMRNKYLF